ncbi:CbiX/SirB N-terminal domain-containing protein [Streptomyces sp. B-S-A12]|uniref:CbiX/SirB N-terminal domain-containing protein n=1 Tax=Streptomyces luteolus TaxID=3043615 RepID=A0ABT6T0T1_9ACTN|nr:CbiX/SirB N-terminal domain-containing protein [Streptomyces sp. B-S-A12]MDI3421454.1 CbiX/SirB N-terminal domain-containing protein [Streptomyces sp. B-S-A12]
MLVADDGTEALRAFVDALGRHSPELPVAGGHLKQVSGLMGDGTARPTVVPLTLAPAPHAERAVASALDPARLSYAYGPLLGGHPVLLDVLERRVEAALDAGAARTPGDRAGVTVLLVGPGATAPEANAEVHRVARLLWEGRGYAGVETAFVSLAAPDVPSGLDRCVRLGARRIVVLPYFLLDGALPDRVRAQAEGWAEAHPEAEVRTADVVGPDPALLDLLVRHHHEATTPHDPRERHAQAH